MRRSVVHYSAFGGMVGIFTFVGLSLVPDGSHEAIKYVIVGCSALAAALIADRFIPLR